MASELHETARALVAEGKGILAADESGGTIKKRFDSIGVESTEENRRAYRELLFTTPGAEEFISGVILFDETIRQTRRRRDAVPGAARRRRGSSPGIKVDAGAKPLALRRRRDDHRGARRAARAARGVPRARRALREVARDVLDRRRAAERVLHLDERARARPLRRALPGGGARPDRRARGADGRRRTRSSAAPTSTVARARTPSTPSCSTSASTSPARCSSRTWCSPATRRPSRAGVDEVAERTLDVPLQARAGRRAGDRLPLRRPVRRGRDRAPERDERARAAPVAAVVLVRPRAAGAGAEGLGRQARERRGRPARVLPPREDERGRAHRHVRARDGAGGRRRREADRCRARDGARLRGRHRPAAVRRVPARRQRRRAARRCAATTRRSSSSHATAASAFVLSAPTWRANPDWGALLGLRRRRPRRGQPPGAGVHRGASATRSSVRAGGRDRDRGAASGRAATRTRRRCSWTPTRRERYHAFQLGALADTGCDAGVGAHAGVSGGGDRHRRARRRRSGCRSSSASRSRPTAGSRAAPRIEDAIVAVDDATDGAAAGLHDQLRPPDALRRRAARGRRAAADPRAARRMRPRLSHAELDEAEELDAGDPADLAGALRRAPRQLPALEVLGGCCGTDIRHVTAICDAWLAADAA